MTAVRQCPLCGTPQVPGERVCQCGYEFSGNATGGADVSASVPSTGTASSHGTIGLLLIGAGLIVCAIAFFLPTTIDSYDGSQTYNLGLMQRQMMVLACGLASAVVGAIFMTGRR